MRVAFEKLLTRVEIRCLPLVGLLGLGLVLLTAGNVAVSAPAPATGEPVLVAFKDHAPAQARFTALQKLGLAVDSRVRSPHFVRALITPRLKASGLTVQGTVEALSKNPAVRVVVPDHRIQASAIPNDPAFPALWGLHNTGQSGGLPDADIDVVEAWEVTTGSPEVVVAVTDTGVDYTHPDLAENILRDRDGNVVGYDFVDGDAYPSDRQRHGTHVAGTIAAVGNNGVGIIGVAPRARIMPLRFLDETGDGSISDAIRCIDFAREHGAHIINASWGGAHHNVLLVEALQRARDAGILFVAAAGNDARNNDIYPQYPASYNAVLDNVISVAATDHAEALAQFSNYGRYTVDIAAPGVSILSTVPAGGYAYLSGTSMATPHVAGVAALIRSRFPSISVESLKARLLGSVDHTAELQHYVSTGRLNALRSLEEDATPPAAITTFRAAQRGATTLHLNWTATGDDGTTGGPAAYYDLRHSTRPITDANFPAATRATVPGSPGEPGQPETAVLPGLYPGQTYYVAIRAYDNAGNPSALTTAGPYATVAGNLLLQDDVESTPRFAGWAVSSEDVTDRTRVYSDSPNQDYASNTDLSLTQIGNVRSPNTVAFVTFRARTDLENGYDFLYVELSEDGGVTWQRQHSGLTGDVDWKTYTVPLVLLRGNRLKVRFHLVSDEIEEGDGVLLDDIHIYTVPQKLLLHDNGERAPQFTGNGSWALSPEASYSGRRAYSDSPGVNSALKSESTLTADRSVSLVGTNAWLIFAAKTQLVHFFDFLHIEVSPDGGETWVRQPHKLTGTSDWQIHQVPLWQFSNSNRVLVRFRLVIDVDEPRDGVWLDDIRIVGEPLQAVREPVVGGQLQVTRQLQFGTVRNGKTRTRVLVLRNRSRQESLAVSVGDPTGDFGVIGLSQNLLIAPGKQQRIQVEFRPRDAGKHAEALEITSSDPQRSTVSVVLKGRAR